MENLSSSCAPRHVTFCLPPGFLSFCLLPRENISPWREMPYNVGVCSSSRTRLLLGVSALPRSCAQSGESSLLSSLVSKPLQPPPAPRCCGWHHVSYATQWENDLMSRETSLSTHHLPPLSLDIRLPCTQTCLRFKRTEYV